MSSFMKILKGIQVVSQDVHSVFRREWDYYTMRPRTATIFLTFRCNSKCMTCSFWKRDHGLEKQKEIDFATWRTIIDKLAGAGIDNVELFGGNVLLRKDLLISLMYYLKDKNIKIHLPTNQIGMDEEIVKAVYHCVDWLYLSTDGVGDKQEQIRGMAGADRFLLDTLSRLKKWRLDAPDEGKPGQAIICNTTVSKFNVDQLERIAEHAVEVGYDEIHFEPAGEMPKEALDASTFEGLTPESYYIKGEESILLDATQAGKLHTRLQDIKKCYEGKITVSTVNSEALSTDSLASGIYDNRRCFVTTCEATLDPSGNLVGCVFFNNYQLGNLVEESFEQVWTSDKRKRFIELQRAGRFPMCDHCIVGVQRNPGLFAALKRVYSSRIRSNIHKLYR